MMLFLGLNGERFYEKETKWKKSSIDVIIRDYILIIIKDIQLNNVIKVLLKLFRTRITFN